MTTVLPVIYIGGYGRSGSTLLDVLLDAQPGILGVGEVTHLFRFAAEQRECSCGQQFVDCPVWGVALGAVMHPNRRSLMAAEALTRAVEGRRVASTRHVARYAELWDRLLHVAASTTGARVIVDSSKSTRGSQFRARRLGQIPSLFLHNVHLRRDPAGVIVSAVAAKQRRAATGARSAGDGDTMTAVRTVVGWITALRSAAIQADLTLDLADLVDDPSASVLSVLALLRPVDGVVPLLVGGPGHGVAGNRMRRLGEPIRAQRAKGGSAQTAQPFPLHNRIVLNTARRLGGYNRRGGKYSA